MRIKFAKLCGKWELETTGDVVFFSSAPVSHVSVRDYGSGTMTMMVSMEDIPCRVWKEGENIYLTSSTVSATGELIFDRDAVAVAIEEYEREDAANLERSIDEVAA